MGWQYGPLRLCQRELCFHIYRGGVRIVLARAVAPSYDGWRLVDRLYDVDVRAGRGLRRASLYMRALEFKCPLKTLEGAKLAVCGGNIYPVINPAVHRRPRQVIEAYYEFLLAHQSP